MSQSLRRYDTVLSRFEIKDIYDYQVAWYDTTYQHLVTIDADDPLVSLDLDGTYLPNQPATLAFAASDPSSVNVAQVQATITDPANNSAGPPVVPADKAFPFNPTGERTSSSKFEGETGPVSLIKGDFRRIWPRTRSILAYTGLKLAQSVSDFLNLELLRGDVYG